MLAIGIYVSNVTSTVRKDMSHFTCFNSNRKGHYAIKCPEPGKNRDIPND